MKTHKFKDQNMADAIANAPERAKYRLTKDPDMGCLLIVDDNRGPSRQPWILRMPNEDWVPFLDAMAAAGKTLVPDPDPEDENDCTPPW